MKKLIKSLCYTLSVAFFAGVKGCPYTFINDSNSPIFAAEEIEKAQFVAPGKKITIEAPMSMEHSHHEGAGEHEWNGHAPIYIYKKDGAENFTLLYKIIEKACGKGSIIKYSDLEIMSRGTIPAAGVNLGRLEVKRIDHPERKKAKINKLTVKGMMS